MKRWTGKFKSQGSRDSEPSRVDVKSSVSKFCETGEPESLPNIVEATSNDPKASEGAAYQIRKELSKTATSGSHLYNAIMLIRILSDHPGAAFTKNIDNKLRDKVKTVLLYNRDPSVQQILRETLEALETKSAQDAQLQPIVDMWREHKNSNRSFANLQANQTAAWQMNAAQVQPPPPIIAQRQLPPPQELAGRVEEAKTTAKLLMQLSQSTPVAEFSQNELIKEFADRCKTAKRNLETYMNCTDPAPDEATFMTLIETCEQLNVATSKYQRAQLAARRATGESPQPPAARSTAPPNQPQSYVNGTTQQHITAPRTAPSQPPLSFNSPPLQPTPRVQAQPQPQPQPRSQSKTHTQDFAQPESQRSPPLDRPTQPLPTNQPNAQAGPPTLPLVSVTVQNEPNPFSDDNQIKQMFEPSESNSPAVTPPVQQNSTQQYDKNVVELPTQAQHGRRSNHGMYLPPPGPPPQVRKNSMELDGSPAQQVVAHDDDEDLYHLPSASSPKDSRLPQRTHALAPTQPATSVPNSSTRLISQATLNNPYPSLSDDSPNGVVSWGEAESPTQTRPPQASRRVQDDDPQTSGVVGGVSGTGWHY